MIYKAFSNETDKFHRAERVHAPSEGSLSAMQKMSKCIIHSKNIKSSTTDEIDL